MALRRYAPLPAFCLACLLFALPAAGGLFHRKAKKSVVGLTKLGEQKEEIKDPHFPAPERNCENWAWAAAVQGILDAKGVQLPQEQWVLRKFGGAVCVDSLGSPGSYAELAASIRGDYMLGPGNRVALLPQFTAGAPNDPDSLIAAIRGQRPILIFWKNHPYLLAGLSYDEYVAQTGEHIFELKELNLYDPQAKSKEAQFVSFVRDRDDPNDINGWMDIEVKPMGQYEMMY